MNIYEKEAILNYLEFGLLTLCNELDQHMDPDAGGLLQEKAYLLLVDMEDTLDMQLALTNTNNKNT